MSIDSRRQEVVRLKQQLATLQKQDADESKKEAAKAKEITQTTLSLNASKSVNAAKTYMQKLNRLNGDKSKIQIKRAGISQKIASTNQSLHRAEIALSKEEETGRKKLTESQKKREREQLEHQRNLTRELERQSSLSRSQRELAPRAQEPYEEHDAFISHATEDKDDFVRPLAEALREAGYSIWYDEFSLSVGDSLRQCIDKGLVTSRFGIVVLSSSFMTKNWPQYELDGLVAREMGGGGKVILPIWHKISKDEMLKFSPSLADKVAIQTSLSSISEIVDQLGVVLARKK